LRAEEEEGEGEEDADTRGRPGREQKERGSVWVAGLRKKNGPAVAHAGEGEERGLEGEERGSLGCWVAGLLFPSPLLFLFLFHTQTIHTIPFEFK
jgi:hypothetical protein